MIGKRELRRMKPSAYLINTGRGELVRATCLAAGVERTMVRRGRAGCVSGRAAAGRRSADETGQRHPDAALVAHNAEGRRNGGRGDGRGYPQRSSGRIPDNIVNTDVLNRPGFRAKLARFNENASIAMN